MKRRSRSFVNGLPALALLLVPSLFVPAPLLADEAEEETPPEVRRDVEERPRTFLDLRLGATSTETWTQICAAGYPLEMLAIEACGNGSGFLHAEAAPEIAHFRGKARLLQQALGPVYVEPWIGFGFAELQVGADASGFDFFGTGPTGVETAGAEASGTLRAVLPLPIGFEVVGNLDLSVAYFPYAPELVRPMSPWQPTLSADLGIGW